jgi:hypothetical protein
MSKTRKYEKHEKGEHMKKFNRKIEKERKRLKKKDRE